MLSSVLRVVFSLSSSSTADPCSLVSLGTVTPGLVVATAEEEVAEEEVAEEEGAEKVEAVAVVMAEAEAEIEAKPCSPARCWRLGLGVEGRGSDLLETLVSLRFGGSK